jgi:hypothetical protein
VGLQYELDLIAEEFIFAKLSQFGFDFGRQILPSETRMPDVLFNDFEMAAEQLAIARPGKFVEVAIRPESSLPEMLPRLCLARVSAA